MFACVAAPPEFAGDFQARHTALGIQIRRLVSLSTLPAPLCVFLGGLIEISPNLLPLPTLRPGSKIDLWLIMSTSLPKSLSDDHRQSDFISQNCLFVNHTIYPKPADELRGTSPVHLYNPNIRVKISRGLPGKMTYIVPDESTASARARRFATL
jgi:hypothetical protein